MKVSQLTEATTPEDADLLPVARGSANRRITKANLFAGYAPQYAVVTITGNTTLTRAAHANRVLRVTSAATLTVGTDFAESDFIHIREDGGVATLAGAFETAPGVTATATNGNKSTLDLEWSTTLNKMIVIGPVAGGGGASVDTDYTLTTFGAGQVLANNTTEQVLATLPIGGAIAKGRIDVWLTGVNDAATGDIWYRVYLNTVGAAGTGNYIGGDPGPSFAAGNSFNVTAICRGAAVQHTSGDRLRNGVALTVDTSGANSIIVTGQKDAAAVTASRAGQLAALQVRVTRLP